MKWLWGVVAGVVLGLVFALLYCRNPLAQIPREFNAIKAERDARQDALRRGAVVARQEIEDQHAVAIHEFSEKQRQKMGRLRADPAALARWLTRVSS